MFVKSKPSKIVYKVYEVWVFAYTEMFSSRKTQRKNQKTAWQNIQDVWNGIIENAKSYPKKYSLNQMLRGNVAFAFDKCLFSAHFLFRKSWNLNQVFHVF